LERFDTYYEAIAQFCNYNIKFIIDNVPIAYNCIVSSKTFDLTVDKMLFLPTGKIMVNLSFSNDTNTIKLGDRFIKMGSPWKISGVDKTHFGSIILQADIDLITLGDDMANEVVYYTGNSTHTYVLVSMPASTSIVIKSTQQLISTVTDKTILVSNPTFTYSSISPTIATISSTGLITAIALGSATIVVSFLGLDGVTYSKTIATTVTNAVARTFTITGSATMSITNPANSVYTVIDNATSLPVSDLVFTYVSSNINYAKVVSSTSNTVTLYPLASGQVKVTATNGSYVPFKIISVQSTF